ncbi:tetratricopeptide repeat protein, partial [Candidatus Woesearchaeota archaeon]|nr:tetratricopeptide repeat protein [Candidatus Woesearchaeota archaeon]
MKVQTIALFCVFVILLSTFSVPLSYAQQQPQDIVGQQRQNIGQLRNEIRQFGEDIQPGVATGSDEAGEDIIINVAGYHPITLRTSLLEEQNVNVFAQLTGLPANPAISIPRIQSVQLRASTVKTEPEGKQAAIGALQYIAPKDQELSFDNLGYIAIPIRRIPREVDVPDKITINADARIFFDVGSILGVGPNQDVLLEQTESEWRAEQEGHRFFAGYIRASEIKEDQASFVLYDLAGRQQRTEPITLRIGVASPILSSTQTFGNPRSLFDRFTVRLEEVKEVEDRVKLLIKRDGRDDIVSVLSVGEFLYPGSLWRVEDIREQEGRGVVQLKRIDNKVDPIFLTFPGSAQRRENRQKVGPQAQSAPTPPNQTKAAPAQTPEDQLRDKYEEMVKEFEDLKSRLGYIGKKDFQAVTDRFSEVYKGAKPATLKNNARDKLLEIRDIYTTEITNLGPPIDTEIESESKEQELRNFYRNKILSINSLLTEVVREADIITIDESARNQNYRAAIQEYRKVVDQHQDVLDDDDRPLGMKALLRAANIYFKIGDTTQALQTYQEVINKYADKLSAAEKGAIELEKAVIETGRSIQGSKAVIVQERDTQVTILPIDLATTMENKPSATLLINGKTVTYKEGDEVTALNQNIAGGYSWYIADIDSKRVLLRAGNTNLQRPLDESLPFGRVTKVKPSQQEGEVSIRVARIDLKRQAKVTILPASERAFTETSFTLHIPIEKRPFDLPLFSESLDKEIQNTQQLIEKLDKVITNVRRIHEFWIKFCYITFGVLWTKNLITGFQGAGVARQQIREKWENKYQEYRAKTTSSGGIPQSFDSFIIQNAKEYNQDQKLAQNIVGEIRNQNGEWKKIQTDFKLDEERAKALYFKSKFIQNDPTIKNKMGTILLEAKEESVKQQVQKDLEVTKNQEQLKNLFVNAGAINQDDFQDPTKFSVFYEQNKPLLESQYKDIKLQQAREEYLKNQEGLKEDLNRLKVGVGDAGPIKDSELTDIYRNTKASALPQKQGLQTISRFEVFRDTKNGEMKLLGGSDNLFGDNACNSKLTQNYELKKDYYVKTQTGCQGIQITDVTSVTAQHKKFLSLYNSGNDKGKIKQISIDSELYAEVGYTTGGRVKDVEVFSRFDPNAELGTGRREGTIEDTLAKYRRLQSNQKSKEITDRLAALQKVEGLVQTCNRNAATKIALTPGTALGGDCGTVTNPAQEEVKTGCVDYMSPGDCRLLFNACDPVICPASRCNAGGRWQVSSVPQTGIIGSVTLCLPNFPEVAFPVCVTGILAGLENIHSILQGYGECLKVSKVQGRSVGICDRVRNVFICETIWREAIAIFNVEGGLLGFIAKKFDKATGGGGEYATFKKSFQDSAGSLKFFTQDYAKNVFAAYAGDSLEEIGTEICKAAVFGKVPAPGDFIDQITRPESPPQVIAFFDEIPFSDIPTTPQSQYSVFFHVYAGENEDILFSLYLQATTEDGRQITNLPRVYVVRNRRVEKGDFFDGNPDRLLASGYNEICIEMRSQTRGLFQECGFGKVTTDYGLNVLTDIVTANKARKQITSAKECVPERGTFTSNDAIASSLGVFSTGLAQTGIIRKCSGYDPDVGTSQDNWAEVGVCGKDEGGRDLGVCYVFLPQIREALKDVVRENTTIQAIQQQREDLAQTKLKERLGILGQEQIGELFIQALEAKARLSYTEAVNLFRQVAGAGDKKKAARAQFEIGRIYEIIADAAIKEGEGCATIESKELCDQNKQCYWQTYSEGSLGVGTSVCLSKRGESVSQPVCTPILSIEKVVQGDISDPISQGDVLSYLTYVTEGDEVLIQANFKGCDLKSGTPVRFELAELLGGTDGLKVMESQDLTLIERTDERKVRLTVGKPSKEQGEVFGRLIFEGRTLVSNSIPIKGSPISTPTEQEVPEIK